MVDRTMKHRIDKSPIQVLDKAISILDALAAHSEAVDLATLAKQVDLPKSTVNRILISLSWHNLVQKDPRSHFYTLGWSLIHLGEAAEKQYDLSKAAAPHLDALVKATGETAILSVRADSHSICVAQSESPQPIHAVIELGQPAPLHATAAGKLYLALLSDEEIREFAEKNGLPSVTPQTITNVGRLLQEIKRIRESGYAVENEEHSSGAVGIAAAVSDAAKSVRAALSIVGPSMRVRVDCIEEHAHTVLDAAQRLSGSL